MRSRRRPAERVMRWWPLIAVFSLRRVNSKQVLRRPSETARVTGNLGTSRHLYGFRVYQDLKI
jgi:hypothetical protein